VGRNNGEKRLGSGRSEGDNFLLGIDIELFRYFWIKRRESRSEHPDGCLDAGDVAKMSRGGAFKKVEKDAEGWVIESIRAIFW